MIGARGRVELFWVALGQGASLLLGILTLKLLTLLLGPEEYGRFVLLLTIPGMLNLFFYGPIGQAVSRYFHVYADAGCMSGFVATKSLLLRRAAGLAIALGAAGLLVLSLLGLSEWWLMVVLALGYGVCAGVLAVSLADFNTRRQRRRYALLQTGDALLRLLLAAMAVYFLQAHAIGALAGFLCGALVFSLLARRGLDGQQRVAERGGLGAHAAPNAAPDASPGASSIAADFTRYAASFSLFALPAVVATYGDRWLIQQTLTAADVGIYVALMQLASAPANLLQAVFSQVMNPILFQRAGAVSSPDALRASRQLLYRTLLLLLVVLLVVVVVSAVFAYEIVMLMTSAAFTDHAYLLWMLVLAAAIFQLGQGLSAEAFIHNRPALLFLPKVAHAVVFIGLSLVLIDGLGLQGVAYAAMVAACAYLGLVAFNNARVARH